MLAGLVAGPLVLAPVARAAPLFGVNESSLGTGASPGQQNYDYVDPQPAVFFPQNVQVERMAFLPERLFKVTAQTYAAPSTSLNEQYLADMQAMVTQDQGAGVMTVLDPHDFGGIATDGTTRSIVDGATGTANYLDAMKRLAGLFAHQPLVAIGLMNEPNGSADTCAALTPVWQQAITLMRGAGFTGPIMLSSPNYDGASSFVGSGCDGTTPGVGFETLSDPAGDLVTEIHEYPDPSGYGASPVTDPNAGTRALQGVVAWAQRYNQQLYLGEIGVQSDATSLSALRNVLSYIRTNGANFWGVTLWTGGPFYGKSGASGAYPLTLNPQADGQPAPQMSLLAQYTAPPEALVLSLSEDAYQGDAPFAVAVDGVVVGGVRYEPVQRATGFEDELTIPGPFTSGAHRATVTFLQDAYGGSPAADRNLFLLGATFGGKTLGVLPTSMLGTGNSATVSFVAP